MLILYRMSEWPPTMNQVPGIVGPLPHLPVLINEERLKSVAFFNGKVRSWCFLNLMFFFYIFLALQKLDHIILKVGGGVLSRTFCVLSLII